MNNVNNFKECFGKIEYDFKYEDLNSDMKMKFDSIIDKAVQAVKEEYAEEQELFNDEFDEQKTNGDVDSLEEFMENADYSINYSLPFQESLDKGDKGSAELKREIQEMTNRFAIKVFDLPHSAIVGNIHEDVYKDKTMLNEAMKSGIAKQIGLPESCFKVTGERTPTVNDKIKVQSFNAVNNMMNSKDYHTYLKLFTPIEKKYSMNNAFSIYYSKPTATVVKGYKAWEELGRKPHSNTGIPILQPMKREVKDEKQVDNFIRNEVKRGVYTSVDSPQAIIAKKKLMETIEKDGKADVMIGYKPVYVFDIADTYSLNPDKDNLQDILNLNKPLLEKVDNFDKVADAIEKVAQELMPNFKIDRSVAQQEAIFDAVEKYADTVLSKRPEKVDGITSYSAYKGDIHKIETAMTAYMICENIGIECADKVSFKLAEIFDNKNISTDQCKLGNRNMFEIGFNRAFSLKNMFNKELNKELGIDLEKEMATLVNSSKTAKEENIKKKEENSDKYEAFGRRQLYVCDKWQKDSSTYSVGYDDVTKTYCVKCESPNKKGGTSTSYACKFTEYKDKKTGTMKPKKVLTSFDKEPTRDSVEYIIDMGKSKQNFDANKIIYVDEQAKSSVNKSDIDLTDKAIILDINSKAEEYYSYFYEDETREDDDYRTAIAVGEEFIKENPDFCKARYDIVQDVFSSDREIASLAFALADKEIIKPFASKEINLDEEPAPAFAEYDD